MNPHPFFYLHIWTISIPDRKIKIPNNRTNTDKTNIQSIIEYDQYSKINIQHVTTII